MISQQTIDDAVQRLIAAARPAKIILFGSYGRLTREKCYMKQPIDLARQFLAVANAVTLRYDLIDMDTLDRERTKKIVNVVRQWADEQINGPALL